MASKLISLEKTIIVEFEERQENHFDTGEVQPHSYEANVQLTTPLNRSEALANYDPVLTSRGAIVGVGVFWNSFILPGAITITAITITS